MADRTDARYSPVDVSPPGETLKELLEERGISQVDLALRMGRPQKTLSEIINGKAAITTSTALELELVLGVPAAFWLTREAVYREALGRAVLEQQLADGKAWAKRFPVPQMEKLGLLQKTKDGADRVRSLLEFFGVASPAQWEALYSSYSVAFRKSATFESDRYALAAWLRAAVLAGGTVRTAPFDRDRFVDALRNARRLTREPASVFTAALRDSMAASGVIVAFVPELPRSRASGATRWLTASRALIQLSLRYKTDDHLWFTFFHEAAHVLLHSKKTIFIETATRQGPEEEEANRWAADFLIPRADWDALSRWPDSAYTKAAIRAFADGIGVSPGIVVGRLQHEGRLLHSHCNDLKRRFEWAKQLVNLTHSGTGEHTS